MDLVMQLVLSSGYHPRPLSVLTGRKVGSQKFGKLASQELCLLLDGLVQAHLQVVI